VPLDLLARICNTVPSAAIKPPHFTALHVIFLCDVKMLVWNNGNQVHILRNALRIRLTAAISFKDGRRVCGPMRC